MTILPALAVDLPYRRERRLAMGYWHKAPLALIVWLAALIGPAVDWTSQYARQEIRWRTFIIGLTDVGELRRCEKCCGRPVEAYAFYGLRLQRPVAGVACKEPKGWTIAFGFMRSPAVRRW